VSPRSTSARKKTEQLWRDYVVQDAHVEKTSSDDLFKITFIRANSKEKQLTCWIDSKTCKMLKLDKYESDGSIKSRYIFSRHKQVGGIWIPLRIDVYNEDGKLAGATEYSNIKVNSGIPDSEFKL
jgi:outer membrane lipoprotein-sorting protein